MLRELGNKVKKMEKLGPVDILYEVHEAAEELQRKVDQKSYLLVNSESWEIGNRSKEQGEPQDLINMDDDNKFLEYKSLSEAVLDLRSVQVPSSWGVSTLPPVVSPENMVKQKSWPAHISFNADALRIEEESKAYESASALSLATFSSLLIEFVARLQNLVDSFQELSEKANFREPIEQPFAAGAQNVGFWTRLRSCLKF